MRTKRTISISLIFAVIIGMFNFGTVTAGAVDVLLPSSEYAYSFGVDFTDWGSDGFMSANADSFYGHPNAAGHMSILSGMSAGFKADRGALVRNSSTPEPTWISFQSVVDSMAVDVGIIMPCDKLGKQILEISGWVGGSWVKVAKKDILVQTREDLKSADGAYIPVQYVAKQLPTGTTKVKVTMGLRGDPADLTYVPALDYVDFYDYTPVISTGVYPFSKRVDFTDMSDAAIAGISGNLNNNGDVNLEYEGSNRMLQRNSTDEGWLKINVSDYMGIVCNVINHVDRYAAAEYSFQYFTDGGTSWNDLRTPYRQKLTGVLPDSGFCIDKFTIANLPKGTNQIRVGISTTDGQSWFPMFQSFVLHEKMLEADADAYALEYGLEFTQQENGLESENVVGYENFRSDYMGDAFYNDDAAIIRVEEEDGWIEIEAGEDMLIDIGGVNNTGYPYFDGLYVFEAFDGTNYTALTSADFHHQNQGDAKDTSSYKLDRILISSLPAGTESVRITVVGDAPFWTRFIEFIKVYRPMDLLETLQDDGGFYYGGHEKTERIALKTSGELSNARIADISDTGIVQTNAAFSGADYALGRTGSTDGSISLNVDDTETLELAVLFDESNYDEMFFSLEAYIGGRWAVIGDYHKNLMTEGAPNGYVVYLFTTYELPAGASQIKISFGSDGSGAVGAPYVDYIDFYQKLPDYLSLSSDVYSVTGEQICGVSPKTAIAVFKANLSVNAGSVEVVNDNGTPLTVGQIYVGTGMIVQQVYKGGTYNETPVVLYGDVNGDGIIDTGDVDTVANDLLKLSELTDVFKTAADIEEEGHVTILSLLEIKNQILGGTPVDQHGKQEEMIASFDGISDPSTVLTYQDMSEFDIVNPDSYISKREADKNDALYVSFANAGNKGLCQSVYFNNLTPFSNQNGKQYLRMWITASPDLELGLTIALRSSDDGRSFLDPLKATATDYSGNTVALSAGNAAYVTENSSITIPAGFKGWIAWELSSACAWPEYTIADMALISEFKLDYRPVNPGISSYYVVDDICLSNTLTSGVRSGWE